MKKNKIEKQTLLTNIWIFVLFNMIFRDLHEFVGPTALQDMAALEVSEVQLLIFGIVLEIPISMVLLTKVLPIQFVKWTNIAAAIITLVGFISTIPSADLDDVFFFVVSSIASLSVIYMAWKLPSSSSSSQ